MKILLQYLFAGNYLSQDEAYIALKDIASGNQNDAQVAAFLSVYNMRVPTVHEMIGFRNALLETATPIKFKHKNTLDIVGTGGDGKDTFNISTLACFVCAGAGVKVTKSGNYGFSSVSGSSNVLEHLGIQFGTTQAKLNEQLESANITFIHVPLFFPMLKNIAHIRKQLQIKTVFNLLGPLVNPCIPKTKIIGVHSDVVGKLYKEVLKSSEINFSIIHAIDGYDEISLTSDTKIFSKKTTQIHQPQSFGFKQIKAEDLHGGKTIDTNAKVFMNVLNGKGTESQNNVVLANAALAISLYEQNSYNAALDMAKNSLYNGKALECFKKLKAIK